MFVQTSFAYIEVSQINQGTIFVKIEKYSLKYILKLCLCITVVFKLNQFGHNDLLRIIF